MLLCRTGFGLLPKLNYRSNCIAEAAKVCAIQTLYCSRFGRKCIVREWLGG